MIHSINLLKLPFFTKIFLISLALSVLYSPWACEKKEEPSFLMTLQINGSVTDAANGSPIVNAEVQLRRMDPASIIGPRSSGTSYLINSTHTDPQGRDYLEYYGFCRDAYLWQLEAEASGYLHHVIYEGFRCTEDVQTFNFQLKSNS